MFIKYAIVLTSFTLLLTLLGCSASQEISSYTPEEIDFDQQAKKHLGNMKAHLHNFDTISKNAKPPYDDPDLLAKLQDELEKAVQEAQAITDLNCPSSRFNSLCSDFVYMRDTIIRLRDDMTQYYASGLASSERQNIINDMKAMTTSSQNIADDYAQLEAQYGKIR